MSSRRGWRLFSRITVRRSWATTTWSWAPKIAPIGCVESALRSFPRRLWSTCTISATWFGSLRRSDGRGNDRRLREHHPLGSRQAGGGELARGPHSVRSIRMEIGTPTGCDGPYAGALVPVVGDILEVQAVFVCEGNERRVSASG